MTPMNKFAAAGAVVLLAIAVGILILTRHSPQQTPGLPSLPDVEIPSLDPRVRDQIRIAREEAESHPDDPSASGKLGVLYELYQYPEAAHDCYQRAVAASSEDFRWSYFLGRSELMLGNPESAIEVLSKTVELAPKYTPAITLLGEAYLEVGLLNEAEAVFRDALEISPRSCSALYGLATVYARHDDHALAIEYLDEALEVAPDHRPLHYAIAMSYRTIGNSEQAKHHFDIASRTVAANPDPDPLITAMLQMEIGEDADYRRAKQMMADGDNQGAIRLLGQIVETNPNHYGAHGALGQALMLSKRYDESLQHFTKAIALNPTNLQFLRSASLLLYRMQRYQEVETNLRKVLELGGDHADDYHILGGALFKLNRYPEAAEAFETTLKHNPDHQEAKRALVETLRIQTENADSD